MENSLVTYGFNKDRERIEHLTWICDQLCTVFSKYIVGNVTAKNYLKESLSSILCFIMICELNWMVFMAIIKHFLVI